MANLYSSHVVLCSILFRLYVPWKPIGGSLNRENCSSKTMTIPLILYNGAKSFHKKANVRVYFREKSLYWLAKSWRNGKLSLWIKSLLHKKPIYRCGVIHSINFQEPSDFFRIILCVPQNIFELHFLRMRKLQIWEFLECLAMLLLTSVIFVQISVSLSLV